MTINTINNNESGSSVRSKINEDIERGNTQESAMINQIPSLAGKVLRFSSEVAKLESEDGDVGFVAMTGYGDSMSDSNNGVVSQIGRHLQTQYGLGALFTPRLGQSWNGAAWTLSGGATSPSNDFSYLPNSAQVYMSAGSSASITTGVLRLASSDSAAGDYSDSYDQKDTLDNTLNFSVVRVFYLTRPGDGELTFTLSQSDVAGYSPVVVDCNGAIGLSYVDINVIDGLQAVTLSASASGAECVMVGAAFYRDKGIMIMSSQVGGITMTQQAPYIDNGNVTAVYKPLCEALNVKLIVHHQRTGDDTSYQANYNKIFNALTANIDADQIVLGEAPRATEETVPVATVNAYLSAESDTRGFAFFDQNAALGSSSALISDLGWIGDGVHLSLPCRRYLGAKILNACDHFRVAGHRLDSDPLSMYQILRRTIQFNGYLATNTHVVSGNAQSTIMNQQSAGAGFSYSASNDKGYTFTGGASGLGSISGSITALPAGDVYLRPDLRSYAICLDGFRNMDINTGCRAFVVIGCGATPPDDLADLTGVWFGIECALGSDVGSPGGFNDEVVRLVYCDGTALQTGPWVRANAAGDRITGQAGFNPTITWDNKTGKLTLYLRSIRKFEGVSSIAATTLASNNTQSSYIAVGLFANDGGNIPASNSNISFTNIKFITDAFPYGLMNNNL